MNEHDAEKAIKNTVVLEEKIKSSLSKRGRDWVDFAVEVLLHIENYTVPQYGDKGEDNLTNWLPGDCMKQTGKYAARHGRNSREQQDLLDILKSAHYSQVAFTKLTEDKYLPMVARRTPLQSMRILQRDVANAYHDLRKGEILKDSELVSTLYAAATAIGRSFDMCDSGLTIREIAGLTAALMYYCESRGINLSDMVEGVISNYPVS